MADARHYKLYKYRDEVEPEEWRETGLNFGGTFSTALWERLAAILPTAIVPSSSDASATMDEVLRNLRGGR